MLNNKRLTATIYSGKDELVRIDENLLYAEFGALDRGDITNVVDWGIYANRGSILFVDNTGIFSNESLIQGKFVDYIVKLFLVDRTNRILISTFNIANATLDDENNTVNIELCSRLLSMEKEKTTGSVYPFYSTKATSLISLIKNVLPRSQILEGVDVKNLSSTYIGCPYIGVDNAWNIMTKLCQATMSRMFENIYGFPQITSSFPEKTPIIVKPNNIISVEQAGFVMIDNASIMVTQRESLEDQILEDSCQKFSVGWDEVGLAVAEDGFTISSQNVDSSVGAGYRRTVNGNIKFNTPYKIFSVGSDSSYINSNLTVDDFVNATTETKQVMRTKGVSASPYVTNETEICASIKDFLVHKVDTVATVSSIKDIVYGGTFRFPISTFLDNGTYTLSTIGNSDSLKEEKIDSNDLIQGISYYKFEDGSYVELGQYILDEVKKRYANGIECFEMECLFNNYYDEDGNKVFDREDLSKHFQRYDVIIPYVKRKGQTVPLRSNEDGTPKKFRIIGISYYYDGLLKQRLQLHEERYDVD